MRVVKITIFVLLSLLVGQSAFAQTNPNALVKARVTDYFYDIPAMITIAQCESGFKQYFANGSPLYDSSRTYIGVFQISEKIHTGAAKGMGYDIATLEGNIAYARYLYNKNGTGPWKGCLLSSSIPTITPSTSPIPSVTTTPPSSPVITGTITANLTFGQTHPQVLLVQQILNKKGFVIASSGPGSSGNETTMFGSLTRAAIQKFQCANAIACEGNEYTTGYGRIGPRTRALLNQ
jgi:hypothetical protein